VNERASMFFIENVEESLGMFCKIERHSLGGFDKRAGFRGYHFFVKIRQR